MMMAAAGPLWAVVENHPDEEEEAAPPVDSYRPSPEGPRGNDRPVDQVLDSNYFPLNWPALAVESAAKPVVYSMELMDRYKIHRRVYDLLTNEERTAAVYPTLSFGTGGIHTIGVNAFHKNLFQSRKVLRLWTDWDMDRAVYEHIKYLDPSVKGAPVYFNFDQQFGRYQRTRYYGLGNESRKPHLIYFRSDTESFAMQAGYGGGKGTGIGLRLSYDHATFSPQVAEVYWATNGVTPEQLDMVRGRNLVGIAGVARFDRRHWKAETLEGFRLLGTFGYYAAPGDNRSRFLKWTADAAWFQPLFRRGRVLMLRAYMESVHPLEDGTASLFDLASVGGDSFLRGYPSGRFRDRASFAMTQEYRFPVWRLVDFTVFADEGRVMSGVDRFNFKDMHVSWGWSLRARRRDFFLWRFVFAQSPEGYRLNFSVNQEF